MKKRLTPRLISEKRGDSYEDQISISFSIINPMSLVITTVECRFFRLANLLSYKYHSKKLLVSSPL